MILQAISHFCVLYSVKNFLQLRRCIKIVMIAHHLMMWFQ